MIDLPQLDRVSSVRIARDGGVAWTPGLSRARSVRLEGYGRAARQRIESALRGAANSAVEAATHRPAADQRVYRVEVVMNAAASCPTISFDVPESQAPDLLVQLWRSAE